MPGKSSGRFDSASPTVEDNSSYAPLRRQGMISTASNRLSKCCSSSMTGTALMLWRTIRCTTSSTELAMVDVARRDVGVPSCSSPSGFFSSTVCCSLLTAMNLRMRYWVMTLTTVSRPVSSSTATSGMRRARDLSMRRQAS